MSDLEQTLQQRRMQEILEDQKHTLGKIENYENSDIGEYRGIVPEP